MTKAPLLIDVSRLIWRRWTGRLPTGIDRVCLAYLEYFGPRANAVVQFRRFRRILDPLSSSGLQRLLLDGEANFRSRLLATLAKAAIRNCPIAAGQIYLNVGHTGLDSPFLGPWLSAQRLSPVFMIHDLIPITHPQFCRDGEADRHGRRMKTALRSARGLIFNSAATQQEVVRFADRHGLEMPPATVSWLGVDSVTSLREYRQEERERPYFLMLGTIEARKNHLLILRIWEELVARLGDLAPDLIVVGQRGWEAEEAIAILDRPGPIQGHVVEIPACDDERLIGLLKGAQALLMPSFAEGYGLPLVEALGLGVPVIASDLPVFREIAGGIPTFLDPNDRQAWSESILDFAAEGPERQRQLQAARQFRAPSWGDHFASVEGFLETLNAAEATDRS